MSVREYFLSVNDFEQPKIAEDDNAVYILLLRLLMLNPGTIQSHPDMGIGIVKLWRYSDANMVVNELQPIIENQITKYLPGIKLTRVSLEVMNDTELKIAIEVNGVIYNYVTNNDVVELRNL